jgi:hypothetical protein
MTHNLHNRKLHVACLGREIELLTCSVLQGEEIAVLSNHPDLSVVAIYVFVVLFDEYVAE